MSPVCSILLSGATGFIGGELLKRLLDRGQDVLAIVRGPHPEARLSRRLTLGPPHGVHGHGQLRALSGEVTLPGFGWSPEERASVPLIADFVHAAGLTDFDPAAAGEVRRTNHVGAVYAARLARDLGARRFVLVSTAFLGGPSALPVPESALPPRGAFLNAYEESKARAEADVARVLEGTATRLLIVRPSIVVNDSVTGFVQNREHLYALWRPLHRLARPDRTVRVDARIEALPGGTKNMIPVDAAAAAIAGLVERPDVTGFVNLVSGRPVRHDDLLALAQRVLGLEGLSLADRAGFEQEPASRLEVRLNESLEPYRDYLSRCEPEFVTGRIATLLPGWSSPPIDEPFLARAFAAFRALPSRDERPAPDGDAGPLVARYVSGHLQPLRGRRLIPGIGNLDAAFTVEVEGHPPGVLGVVIGNGALVEAGLAPRGAVTFRLQTATFSRIIAGRVRPVEEFLAGRVDIVGEVEEGLRLVGLLTDFFTLHPFVPRAVDRR